MVSISGGPPHQDMFDLQPDAPSEMRGEFQPIDTIVLGIRFCEHLSRIASMMDKFAVIRSQVEAQPGHTSFQCATGCTGAMHPHTKRPSIDAMVSNVRGPVNRAAPPAIDLSQLVAHAPYNIPGPGFLGLAHTPFRADGEPLAGMALPQEVGVDRIADRKGLLLKQDRLQEEIDEKSRRTSIRS